MDLKKRVALIGILIFSACSTGPSNPEVGHCNPDLVNAALLKHKKDFAACYALNAERKTGRVEIFFVVHSDGKAQETSIQMSTLNEPLVEECILKTLRTMVFPTPEGGSTAELQIPFKFNAAQKAFSGIEYIEGQY